MKTKICPRCHRQCEPSCRHRICSKCRHVALIDKSPRCPTCGHKKQPKSIHCFRCVKRGYNKNNWQGGKISKKGYTMVGQHGHPRASRRGHYVFEHILVMEKILKRFLLPGESVHHKNGVRNDNHRKNLELWIKSHPSGIRMKDAVKWAKEILRRYEPRAIAK